MGRHRQPSPQPTAVANHLAHRKRGRAAPIAPPKTTVTGRAQAHRLCPVMVLAPAWATFDFLEAERNAAGQAIGTQTEGGFSNEADYRACRRRHRVISGSDHTCSGPELRLRRMQP